jgi:hypothetical protein
VKPDINVFLYWQEGPDVPAFFECRLPFVPRHNDVLRLNLDPAAPPRLCRVERVEVTVDAAATMPHHAVKVLVDDVSDLCRPLGRYKIVPADPPARPPSVIEQFTARP